MLDSTHFAAQNTTNQTTLDSFKGRVQVPWIHQFESSSWKMIPLLLTSFPVFRFTIARTNALPRCQ